MCKPWYLPTETSQQRASNKRKTKLFSANNWHITVVHLNSTVFVCFARPRPTPDRKILDFFIAHPAVNNVTGVTLLVTTSFGVIKEPFVPRFAHCVQLKVISSGSPDIIPENRIRKMLVGQPQMRGFQL